MHGALKRSLDVALSLLALVATLPLWLLIAIAIKVDSRGPFIYRQVRMGRGGRPFRIVKFRTMVVGAEALVGALRSDAIAGPHFKLRDDPRVTRVGRWLRRYSLDELPQFWNVLRGDMSLVGPRPPLPEEAEFYDERERARLLVRPGITGLWQVSGRSNLGFEECVRLDLQYIAHWSLATDLRILWRTLPAVLTGRGAY
jgi:exopolysaccharide biosynthesis polyprenyl glycosylphosphotransferase